MLENELAVVGLGCVAGALGADKLNADDISATGFCMGWGVGCAAGTAGAAGEAISNRSLLKFAAGLLCGAAGAGDDNRSPNPEEALGWRAGAVGRRGEALGAVLKKDPPPVPSEGVVAFVVEVRPAKGSNGAAGLVAGGEAGEERLRDENASGMPPKEDVDWAWGVGWPNEPRLPKEEVLAPGECVAG